MLQSTDNVSSADNQHATFKLAWLSGILDGEGSLMIYRNSRNGKYRYGYRVSISNTNLLIINKCKEILEMLGIKYCSYIQDRRKENFIRKKTHLIHITNKKGILSLLDFTTPYIIGKRKQARFLQSLLRNWETSNKLEAYLLFKKLNERIPK